MSKRDRDAGRMTDCTLSRRHFVGTIGGAAAIGAMPGALHKAMASAAAPAGSKPNFVFIFTDDQGYADLGCFGSTTIKTPNVDKMAAEGIKFTDFHAAPVCTPSRASLMTGSYPQRNGMGCPGGGDVLFPGRLGDIMTRKRPRGLTVEQNRRLPTTRSAVESLACTTRALRAVRRNRPKLSRPAMHRKVGGCLLCQRTV